MCSDWAWQVPTGPNDLTLKVHKLLRSCPPSRFLLGLNWEFGTPHRDSTGTPLGSLLFYFKYITNHMYKKCHTFFRKIIGTSYHFFYGMNAFIKLDILVFPLMLASDHQHIFPIFKIEPWVGHLVILQPWYALLYWKSNFNFCICFL